MDSFHSIYTAVRRMTKPMILRNLESLFYFFFLVLAFTGFILPFALEVSKVACYTVGGISIIYAIGLFYLRFKVNVIFGLILHTAVIFLLTSFIIFDFGLFEIGYALVAVTVIGICVIIILCGLGHRVFANGANQPQVILAWPEIGNQDNADGQVMDQINLNHWRFNGDANPPAMQNVVNPEIQNNDVADPQMQDNDNLNPQLQDN